jgi:putative hydrolase of the HAD superfamily
VSNGSIQALFCDLGGVLLTNGWDAAARRRAAIHFDLEQEEFDSRHTLYFPLYELGHFSLDVYLDGVIFYKKRSFSRGEFLDFIHAQSHVDMRMMAILKRLRLCRADLKIVALSNEGAELARYRARKFQLMKVFSSYLISGFIHLRKPDPAFYQLALDTVQLSPNEVVYIDDRSLFVEVAERLGIHAYCHLDSVSTALYLEQQLQLVEGALQLPGDR